MSSIVETVVVAPVLPGQGGGDDENQPASPRNQVNALGVGDSTFNTPPTQAQSKNLLLQARGLPSDVSRAIVDLVPLVCPGAPRKRSATDAEEGPEAEGAPEAEAPEPPPLKVKRTLF